MTNIAQAYLSLIEVVDFHFELSDLISLTKLIRQPYILEYNDADERENEALMRL